MKKILLIEDSQEIRENIAEILSLANYEVAEAENGKIGVEKAKKEHPDLIICDIMMPQANGYTVLNELRNHPETAHIPFIFLTASAEKSEVKAGLGMGAEGYIRKPFGTDELLRTIESCLIRHPIEK